MRGEKQKEFWLEPSPSVAEEEVGLLADAAHPDTLLLGSPIKTTIKTACRSAGGQIFVTRQPEDLGPAKSSGVLTALEVTVREGSDHNNVLEALKYSPDYLIVDCPDWKVIPLENLIADRKEKTKLLARTHNSEESRVALNVLELGVDGITLLTNSIDEANKTHRLFIDEKNHVELSTGTVELVKPISTGTRVCVDTTELILPGEGLLVGCSSQALFLVEAEVHSNPHVDPRPFRVNAGPVSLYVLSGDNRTRYLSELEAGDSVVVVDKTGGYRNVNVARVKIERRPLLLVQARVGGRTVKTIAQNAETVRLLGPSNSTPVSLLKPGDEITLRLEEGGRHFGARVEHEMIIEK